VSYQDFKDILSALHDEGVEFLVVGAHAMAVHGFVRATGDLDLWVRASSENARRLARAFESFGGASLGVFDVTEEELSTPGIGIAIGTEPNRVDLHTSIAGLEFDDASADAIDGTLMGTPVRVLGHASLVRAKRAAIDRGDPDSPKRHQDRADLAWLESRGPKKRE
jgi:hypothetical protein